jgi:fermentation-respiration switch protein FrsA (DUF1100 family)
MFQFPHTQESHPFLKRVVWSGLGAGVGVLAAVAAVSAYIVNVLTRPKRLDTFSLYTFSPFELGVPAEDVEFPSLGGHHEVNGWYIPHPEAKTTLIICPGYRGTKTDVLGMSVLLWKAGHNVLVFEYYGHGTVVGTPVTLGYREIHDFLGAVEYAKLRAPETRLGAVGYSMGAAVSIMAAARTPEIEALVADSAFATHRRVVAYAVWRTLHLPFLIFDWITDLLLLWRAGYRLNQVEPLRDIGRIAPRPVLFIHGEKDSIVNPADAPLLYKAAGEPKELWMVEGADHCGAYFVDRERYMKKVINFFDTYLMQRSPVQQQSPLLPTQAAALATDKKRVRHWPEAS